VSEQFISSSVARGLLIAQVKQQKVALNGLKIFPHQQYQLFFIGLVFSEERLKLPQLHTYLLFLLKSRLEVTAMPLPVLDSIET
jgi:hypothetical protein